MKITPELEYLQKILIEMTAEFETAFNFVDEKGDNEYLDFHARRLVEMAGNIIMGYLLLRDTTVNEDFMNATEMFIKTAVSQNAERARLYPEFGTERPRYI